MPIVLENVSHVYMPNSAMSQTALNNVSFRVEEGEFFCIIGHTGSGKTTLLQHMNGLVQPSGGRVLVDGLDLSVKKQRVEARSRVGLVFQYPEYQLFEETVFSDIAFGPKNLHVPEAEIRERVEEAMLLVGLAPDLFAEKSPFDLSGGEKRRAALAGILAMRPRYLLLDEPMAGLDPKGRQSVIDLLQALREKTGCAIVMVSHSMDDVARNAEKIAVLNHGALVMLDTPKNVFAEPEKLIDLGLDIPQAAQLALKLRERGVQAPAGAYREEELYAFLLEALK
ncbi:MAG TPA: energy-coupling factor transporter ATPase [Feifaniaceae bacterium]|nr:energy-coupling factor transporter ATPase [Feifaniaceae bacterium]